MANSSDKRFAPHSPREDQAYFPTLHGQHRPTRGMANAVDKWCLKQMLHALGDPPIRMVLWDDQEVFTSNAASVARVIIHERGALLRLAADPDLQFGELYSQGRIDVEGSLLALLRAVYRAQYSIARKGFMQQLANWLYHIRCNTKADARNNIHHHYDIGNDFYQLWLDRQLVYTCAYFRNADSSLEQAQIDKMDHVCRKLQLKPGEQVVEAGCGWGALALHMARQYGVAVRAFNISREQIAYARSRARTEGLNRQIEFIEGDYREITGKFDVFVSVGMLEHVGLRHYPELGEIIDRCLDRHGRGLIHTIGRDRPGALNRWIVKRIFPGAQPPSLSEMMCLFEPWGFSVLDVENIRLHYAKTLAYWSQRFNGAEDQVEEMFDRAFVRSWWLYLMGSQAAFETGTLQLFQVLFQRAGDNRIPWTRSYIYHR